MPGCQIVSLRVHSGDDASCLNLFQARQPRILGVPPAMIERGGFAWSATAAKTAEEKQNPWLLLNPPKAQVGVANQPADRRPVVLDETTAHL